MKTLLISIVIGLIPVFSFGQDKKFTSQNNNEFAKTIADTTVQLVDVRTATEYQSGHIPRAINMDVNSPDFAKQVKTLNRKFAVAVYCRSGVRSKKAARQLAAEGFTVYELNRGFMNWKGEIQKQNNP